MGKLRPRGVGRLIESQKAGKTEIGLRPRMPDPVHLMCARKAISNKIKPNLITKAKMIRLG